MSKNKYKRTIITDKPGYDEKIVETDIEDMQSDDYGVPTLEDNDNHVSTLPLPDISFMRTVDQRDEIILQLPDFIEQQNKINKQAKNNYDRLNKKITLLNNQIIEKIHNMDVWYNGRLSEQDVNLSNISHTLDDNLANTIKDINNNIKFVSIFVLLEFFINIIILIHLVLK